MKILVSILVALFVFTVCSSIQTKPRCATEKYAVIDIHNRSMIHIKGYLIPLDKHGEQAPKEDWTLWHVVWQTTMRMRVEPGYYDICFWMGEEWHCWDPKVFEPCDSPEFWVH